MLMAAFWCVNLRLVSDASAQVPPDAIASFTLVRTDAAFLRSPAWTRFLDAVPSEAAQALKYAAPGRPLTVFAVSDAQGVLNWQLLETMNAQAPKSAKWRWIPRSAQAYGFIVVDHRPQPFTATFQAKTAMFEVGLGYRGVLSDPQPFNAGRRLIQPMTEQIAHLEKPAGVVWSGVPGVLRQSLQRFKALSDPWSWPGHVEVTVSASSTGNTLLPFVLYYHPTPAEPASDKKIDDFAKNLLADAVPQTEKINLPDHTQMVELRRDPDSIKKTEYKNRFGQLLKFVAPGNPFYLSVFHADVGETWASTDLSLIQAALLSNVGSQAPTSACEKGGAGGYASFAGALLPGLGRFSLIAISLRNLETGMFTICGYYGS